MLHTIEKMLYTIDNIIFVYNILIMLYNSKKVVDYRKYYMCIYYIDNVTYD